MTNSIAPVASAQHFAPPVNAKDRVRSTVLADAGEHKLTVPAQANAAKAPPDISPATFLGEFFGLENVPHVWVCAFPERQENWTGRRYAEGYLRSDTNNYFCLGMLNEHAARRASAEVIAHYAVVADDVGTKTPREEWDALFALGFPRPRFIVETSPKNFTYYWVLGERPLKASDAPGVRSLRAVRRALVRLGLGDNIMDDARYVRVPMGINSKEKYLAAYGFAPKVQLVEHNPQSVLWLDQALDLLVGPDWRTKTDEELGLAAASSAATVAGALERTADIKNPDPYVQLWQALGRETAQVRGGVIEAPCPNIAAHTSREETGFAFLGGGLMHCNHGHCAHLSTPDFQRMMREQYDSEMPARTAIDMDLGAAPQTAAEFLARADFARHGAFDEGEMARTIETADKLANDMVAAIEAGGGDKGKPHERAIRTLEGAGSTFHRDQHNRLWVSLAGCLYDVETKDDFLAILGWLTTKGVSLTGNARTAFKEVVEALAYAGKRLEMNYRQANGPDRSKPEAFINRMDGNGKGIHVDGSGWRTAPLSTFPVNMADRAKSKPLPLPVRANDGVSFIDRWGRHVPLAPVKDANDPNDTGVQQRAMWLAFLLAQFYRPGTVPHMLFAGHQGGGKTTTARRAKALTDPDTADVLAALPPDATALYAIASQQSNLVLDNLSSIRSEHSDGLCGLASGTSYQGRKLYTDREREVSAAKASFTMTSVHDELIKREDLMDRTLSIHLPHLDPANRKTEAQMDAEWDREAPFLMADLLDLTSAGLGRLAAVQFQADVGLLPPPPRFADAAYLAEAACQSLGWRPGLCIEALNAARRAASSDQLESNPVAVRVRELVRTNGGSWSGTPAALTAALRMTDGPEWARQGNLASAVSSALMRAEEPMRATWGVKVERTRNKAQRTIKITGPAK